MIFQLILLKVDWYQYFINALLVVLGRSLDILSTRYVSKELKLETNKLAQKIGWRGMILIQIPIVIVGALNFYFAFFIFLWSVFIASHNIEGSWFVRDIGEKQYQEELITRVKRTKIWKIIVGECSSLIIFTLSGILILIFLFIIKDLLAVFFIVLALIFQGSLSSIRSILFLIGLKKEKPEKEKTVDSN